MMTPAELFTVCYSAGIVFNRCFLLPLFCQFASVLVTAAISLYLVMKGKKPVVLLCLVIFFAGSIAYGLASSGSWPASVNVPGTSFCILLRDRLIAVMDATIAKPYSSLLESIIFGAKVSRLPYEIQANCRDAGAIHIMVVSGLQVSIIVSALLFLADSTGLPSLFKLLMVSAGNFVYAVMAGCGPGILRSAIMAEAALFARTFDRSSDFYNSLSIAAFLIILFDPASLFEVGFQLSFTATWALFYVAPVLEEKFKPYMPERLASMLSISIVPPLITMPLGLFYFGRVSLVSAAANFFIIPCMELTVMVGFASTLIGMIFLPVAQAINNSLTILLILLDWIIRFFAKLPCAARSLPSPHPLTIIISYIIIVAGVETLRGKARFDMKKTFAALFLMLFISTITLGDGNLRVTFFDVGQGDSMLIESPSGIKVLIDGGNYWSGIVQKLRRKGIGKLDLVVLTHPDGDHMDGLLDVLSNIQVMEVLDPGLPSPKRSYANFLALVRRNRIKLDLARAGQTFGLGVGVKLEVLNPIEPFIRRDKDPDLNDNCVVAKLICGRTSFLFTGDLAKAGEDRMLAEGLDVKSDVLKVGHHGSRYSSFPEFLNAVAAEYAVISVGRNNRYGHPSAEALERLKSAGAEILRTDILGDIVFESDGRAVRFSTN